MARIVVTFITLLLLLELPGVFAWGQAPSGPIPPKPGVEVQLPPADAQAKVKVRVALVNTPVTVRDGRGEMVHNLEARDFQIADNGVAQQISHFDLGGDPISMVILIETSSRIAPLLPERTPSRIWDKGHRARNSMMPCPWAWKCSPAARRPPPINPGAAAC